LARYRRNIAVFDRNIAVFDSGELNLDSRGMLPSEIAFCSTG
jgi:hypothetical protein